VIKLAYIAVAGALLVFGAAAQETVTVTKDSLDQTKVEAEVKAHAGMLQMKMVGAVKGMTVLGAPYSGEEVSETNQTLADGTRIHRETRTTVYRDSQGRTRRETPDDITITDPAASVTYFLDPKTMTGQKLTMVGGNYTFIRSGSFGGAIGAPGPSTFTMTTGAGPARIILNGEPLDDKAVAEAMAKAKASGTTQTITYERREVITAAGSGAGSGSGAGGSTGGGSGSGSGIGVGAEVGMLGTATGGPVRIAFKKPAGESLGKQVMEGVNAEGTRYVSTIEAGAIGNDRPIQISSESWYSPDLQMVIMSKHSDPRTGDESFRVTDISRGEPAAYLFQLPAGYQISERK
jgi:hypothetical protein